ncbi:MSHA-type pilus biogenesis protein MshL [Beggiatoa alba B18LD]|uniref:MSHA-type pilus biogenesis protein MshL n=1 Tax=Beggiatoa alba B18LD TaxID=395493 RepID=I3CIF8_9GAMM|nr:pilus (MSHA type) biogenesis protein MshL [Beggiatoa alba]EIJ43401.1 MSHA-type pilus biogenesis protein MshL [Beggiatoa alba B18LD]
MSFSSYQYFWACAFLIVWSMSACAPQPPVPSQGHLNTTQLPKPRANIPPPVIQTPPLPPPQAVQALETYSVTVSNVPVEKLLLALARDANLNIDIHSGITGMVSLNALDQTLPQLLDRISRQANLRYEITNDRVLIVRPDTPELRTYKVSYVNMSREVVSETSIATQVASTGTVAVGEGNTTTTSGNNSTSTIKNVSNNDFWKTLQENIRNLLNEKSDANSQAGDSNITVNPETGILTVRATYRQHQDIQQFLDNVMNSAQRQVLIETTIAEVRLNNQYQAGVDWQRIHGDFRYAQQFLADNLVTAPAYTFAYTNPDSAIGNISATVKMLEEFGTVKVLSSPKLMVLNNQTAILKVVDNRVYFTVDVKVNDTETRTSTTYGTKINTVPVGLIMNVTPQISEAGQVTLNVHPTISRIIGFVNDPNPELASAGVTSPIPEIQVREIESILKVNDGDVAIIGGLMQDTTEQGKTGLPVLSNLPVVGDAFSYRDDTYSKTELIIFLRPVVVKQASLNGDLSDYQQFLPTLTPDNSRPTGLTGH